MKSNHSTGISLWMKQTFWGYHELWSIAIKRWNANTAHAHKLELHWLSDSLLKAYGCCVYVKIIILDGPVTTSLVQSKSLAKSHANSNHPKVRTYGHTFINKVNH